MRNILRDLMNKIDIMQEQMVYISREVEITRKLKKELPEIINIVGKMRNTFKSFISRLDTAEESISKLESTSIETFNIEKQREKKTK